LVQNPLLFFWKGPKERVLRRPVATPTARYEVIWVVISTTESGDNVIGLMACVPAVLADVFVAFEDYLAEFSPRLWVVIGVALESSATLFDVFPGNAMRTFGVVVTVTFPLPGPRRWVFARFVDRLGPMCPSSNPYLSGALFGGIGVWFIYHENSPFLWSRSGLSYQRRGMFYSPPVYHIPSQGLTSAHAPW
jgi:hypothetical protein